MRWLKEYWPIIGTVAAGLVGFGSLRADVNHLEDTQSAQKSDHDLIVRTDERVGRIEQDVRDMKQDIKDIAKAVKE